jgi:DNA repair exonuclease SbcCD nuclease subunit
MSGLFYIGDLHLTKKNPAKRKDDYYKTMTEKINYIDTMAKLLDVYAILLGGDILDSPHPTWDNLDIIRDLNSNLFKNKQVYYIYGNHDLEGDNSLLKLLDPDKYLNLKSETNHILSQIYNVRGNNHNYNEEINKRTDYTTFLNGYKDEIKIY